MQAELPVEPQMFLTQAGIQTRYGFSRSTLVRLRATGVFPKPVRIGQALRWSVKTLEAWEAAGFPISDPEKYRQVQALDAADTGPSWQSLGQREAAREAR